MDVANASMYDGSTADAEAVLMAQRVTRRKKAVLSGGLASALRRGRRRRVATAGDRRCHGGRSAMATEDADRAHRWRDSLRRRADARVSSARSRDLTKIAEAAHAKGALLVVVCHRGRVARPDQVARRDGRRHRRRRGPVDRQRAEFRRALRRPVRDAREVRAPDAGPARAARRSTPRAGAASC